MANPYQQGSSGIPSDGGYSGFVPRTRSPYAPIASGTNSHIASSSSTHPSITRLSHLLNPPHDLTPDLNSSHHSSFRSHNSMDTERNTASPDGGVSSLRSRAPQLPSFSRAFEMFLSPAGDSFWSSQHRHNGFFTPSYLRGSSYIHKLEEAHKAKQAQKEAQQQAAGSSGLQTGQDPPSAVPTKPATHLGMTYDVIERAIQYDSDDTIPHLPTRWNKDDKHGGLEVMGEGQEVKYTAPKPTGEREYEACAIRADYAMPAQAGIYYYEVTVLSRKRDETTVCLGFTSKTVSLSRRPGWESESYGYHGDDGSIYAAHNVGKHYGAPFTTGDTIGCGVNFRTGNAFFTKNGIDLGIAFPHITGKMYPVIGMKRTGEHIRVNFGQTPFVYDIDGKMKEEQAKIRKAISATSTEKLASPSMSETELIQQLVLQFLHNDGYVETARAFAEEIQEEKTALSVDSTTPVEGINLKDDVDANRRQRIRRAILEGDIDKALKFTKLDYPHVLKENEQVYFRLRCRKFIEMVRKSGELNYHQNGSSKKSNGLSVEDHPNEMDLDENSFSDKMETEDGLDSSTGHDAVTTEMIMYGMQLQEDFKGDSRKDIKKTLDEVFSLLAYSNPLEVKEVAHLLDRRGRVAVAEELNSAILMSLGKSSRSALENLYGQTSVLLDYLREDGGPGSFVTIQSVVDEIPKFQPF
ncbi:SPRY domain-containing protein [Xylariales sp. AK1849]|nr:SPRY domain-containing protein [Xylariales sp. AK1849]